MNAREVNMNKLYYDTDEVCLEGFKYIIKKATLCIYPGGLAIVPYELKEDASHRTIQIRYKNNDIKAFENPQLFINLFKGRDIPKYSDFIYDGKCYYELKPHRETSSHI